MGCLVRIAQLGVGDQRDDCHETATAIEQSDKVCNMKVAEH